MDTEEGKKSTTNHKINLYSYTLKSFCVFVGKGFKSSIRDWGQGWISSRESTKDEETPDDVRASVCLLIR